MADLHLINMIWRSATVSLLLVVLDILLVCLHVEIAAGHMQTSQIGLRTCVFKT